MSRGLTLQLRRRGAARISIVGVLLFALTAGFALWRQNLYIKNMKPYRPYLSANIMPGSRASGAVKAMALGYDDAVAVLLWLRTIQDFGGQFRDPFALRAIGNAFWSMASLSPLFTQMYDFGGLVIGDEGGADELWLPRVGAPGAPGTAMQGLATSAEAFAAASAMREQAMQLFELGIEQDVDHYMHAYNAVYMTMSSIRDPQRGVPYAEVATTRADCPEWVEGVIPFLLGRSGQYRVALSQWFSQLRRAIENGDDLTRSTRLRKIAEDGVNPWNTQILNDALQLWIAMHSGALPDSLQRLVDEGYLQYYPEDMTKAVDQWRNAHGQMPPDLATVIRDGQLPQSAEPLRFFDYTRFMSEFDTLLETRTPFASIPESQLGLERYLTVSGRIPECPLSLWAVYSNDGLYLRWLQEIGPFTYAIDRLDKTVHDTSRLAEDTLRDVVGLRGRVDQWHRDHGSWPNSLTAILSSNESQHPIIERGTGAPFAFDPNTGFLRSAAFASTVFVASPEVGVADPFLLGRPRNEG